MSHSCDGLCNRRFFWTLLLIGIAIRMVGLTWPLVDAHNTRQCQTASITRNMALEPGFSLSGHADWLGDEPGRLLLEFPIYNYMAIGVSKLTGNLDVAGKLVSILCWCVAFALNFRIMSRFLTPMQLRWGCILFAFSPLSVFYGQAFLIEMLVLAISLAFILTLLRYGEAPTYKRFTVCVGVGVAAAVLKSNETSHLFLLAGLLFLEWEGIGAVQRLRYWLFAILIVMSVQLWSSQVQAVNEVAFAEWTPSRLIGSFVGPLKLRMQAIFYGKALAYHVLLLTTPLAALFVALGVWRQWKRKAVRFYIFWLFSLFAFYLVWGPGTAFLHSYYNLPFLPVAAAMFGIGATRFIAWISSRWGKRALKPAVAAVTVILLMSSFVGTAALFWPEREVLEAATALNRLMGEKDAYVLSYPNHTHYSPHYRHYTTLFHVAKRRGWNEDSKWSRQRRQEVHDRCHWIVELRYRPDYEFPLRKYSWFSRKPTSIKPVDWIAADPLWSLVEETASYRIWKRKDPSS